MKYELTRFRWWIVIASCLLGIGFAVGLVFTLSNPVGVTTVLSEELAALQRLAENFRPFQFMTVVFIFVQNASTLMLSFLLSPLLCLIPFIALLFNGLLLGFISVIVAQQESAGLVLAGLLPHGIFELPAIIMGEAAALSFGTTLIVALFSKKHREMVIPSLKQNLKYLAIAGALLVPAAVIETFVTPLFLQ